MLVLCGGCRQLFGIASPDHLGDAAIGDGIAIDAAIDTLPDTPPGAICYGAGFGRTCFHAPPQGDLALNQAIDTDTSAECDVGNVLGSQSWCVIAAKTITISGTVAATGMKPLVLIATNTIAVAGNLDASTRRGVQVGAGSVTNDATLCDAGSVAGPNGGGAGGSFGSAGGRGGTSGGIAGLTKPAAMRGGCSGQDGRSGTPGVRGIGGGAVYFIAGTGIMVGGKINASGGGGSGGVNGSGGAGGGGSGGLIAFDAPSVTMSSALIIANGAGGGEGATTLTGNPGGESTGGIAPGGTGGTGTGGDGGDGAAATTPAGIGGNGAGGAGGGGGGGGVGVIVVFQAPSIGGTGTVSPPPT
jgi:hypothetical protein